MEMRIDVNRHLGATSKKKLAEMVQRRGAQKVLSCRTTTGTENGANRTNAVRRSHTIKRVIREPEAARQRSQYH